MLAILFLQLKINAVLDHRKSRQISPPPYSLEWVENKSKWIKLYKMVAAVSLAINETAAS
jgi:hypothetical protein